MKKKLLQRRDLKSYLGLPIGITILFVMRRSGSIPYARIGGRTFYPREVWELIDKKALNSQPKKKIHQWFRDTFPPLVARWVDDYVQSAGSKESKLFTRSELAEYLGISPDFAGELGRFHLPYIMRGQMRLYKQSDIDHWIFANTKSRYRQNHGLWWGFRRITDRMKQHHPPPSPPKTAVEVIGGMVKVIRCADPLTQKDVALAKREVADHFGIGVDAVTLRILSSGGE